jgi:hypothetical protein
MLVVDAPRPISGKRVLELLGLSNPDERLRFTSAISLLIRSTIFLSCFCP